jgi:isoquinoline 1-oxidoreductase beta subunit
VNEIILASRRGFLGGLFSAGALILAGKVSPSLLTAREVETNAASWKPNVWIGLEPNGSIVIVAHRSEMGTGIRTTLPMVLADELGADWRHVRVEQALADENSFGSQNTDGSCSIRDFYAPMRNAGATARLMLERAAAAQWNVPAAECRSQNHEVIHSASGRRIGFGSPSYVSLATAGARSG